MPPTIIEQQIGICRQRKILWLYQGANEYILVSILISVQHHQGRSSQCDVSRKSILYQLVAAIIVAIKPRPKQRRACRQVIARRSDQQICIAITVNIGKNSICILIGSIRSKYRLRRCLQAVGRNAIQLGRLTCCPAKVNLPAIRCYASRHLWPLERKHEGKKWLQTKIVLAILLVAERDICLRNTRIHSGGRHCSRHHGCGSIIDSLNHCRGFHIALSEATPVRPHDHYRVGLCRTAQTKDQGRVHAGLITPDRIKLLQLTTTASKYPYFRTNSTGRIGAAQVDGDTLVLAVSF